MSAPNYKTVCLSPEEVLQITQWASYELYYKPDLRPDTQEAMRGIYRKLNGVEHPKFSGQFTPDLSLPPLTSEMIREIEIDHAPVYFTTGRRDPNAFLDMLKSDYPWIGNYSREDMLQHVQHRWIKQCRGKRKKWWEWSEDSVYGAFLATCFVL